MKRRKPMAILLALAVFITAIWIPIPAQAAKATLKISHKNLNLTVGDTLPLRSLPALRVRCPGRVRIRK